MLRARFLFEVVAPSVLLCWTAVLTYSAVAGPSGYRALAALEAELADRGAELDALRARRMALEKRADQLSSKSLDPDLVDERIRAILGYSRAGDVVISRTDIEQALRARERPAD